MSTILVIAGGPSVKTLDLDMAAKFRTIAVNDSWEIAPWAEECFAGDHRWWLWNGARILREFEGEMSSGVGIKEAPDNRVTKYIVSQTEATLWLPTHVYGPDSGTKAISRAYHRGAKTILLAGFDLAAGPRGETHHHGNHKVATNPADWAKWGSCQKRQVELLADKGVKIFRVTEPGLECIPYRPLETFYEGKPSIRAARPQQDCEHAGDTVLRGSGVRQL